MISLCFAFLNLTGSLTFSSVLFPTVRSFCLLFCLSGSVRVYSNDAFPEDVRRAYLHVFFVLFLTGMKRFKSDLQSSPATRCSN